MNILDLILIIKVHEAINSDSWLIVVIRVQLQHYPEEWACTAQIICTHAK